MVIYSKLRLKLQYLVMNECNETSLRLLEDGVAFGRPLADERASTVNLVFVRLRPDDVLDASEAPLADAAQGGLESRDGGAGPQPDERALRGHLVDLELLDLRIGQATGNDRA